VFPLCVLCVSLCALCVKQRKTRIAPTPSGFLHEGNAFAFLLTSELAKRHGASILLRIDDLDNDRKRPEYVEDIFLTLEWLGIEWQEGPRTAAELDSAWSQHHRLHLFEEALTTLREKGLVYACGCSRKQLAAFDSPADDAHACSNGNLPLDTPDTSWRLRIPRETEVCFKKLNGEMTALRPADLLPDPVVRRRDGIPAYQVASVVDDHHFGIDLIVRGEDLLPSTAVQLFIAQQLGFSGFLNATFHHHSLVLNEKGEKWSKSAGTHVESQLCGNDVTRQGLLDRVHLWMSSHT
jgi:glutamyl-Q tRNA(Asp) synthetase